MDEDFLTLEQFPTAKLKVETVFHVDRTLPEGVFKRPYRFHLLHEFDNGMGDFLEVLRKTHSPYANETVLLSVLDPDPIGYFYRHYRKINAFYFKGYVTESEYYDLRWRNPGNEADAIMFNTEIETYVPDSAIWAMWGERSSEIAVIGLDDPEVVAHMVMENGFWMDAETASIEFAGMPYAGHEMPDDIRRTLIANYGSRADLERTLGREGRVSLGKGRLPAAQVTTGEKSSRRFISAMPSCRLATTTGRSGFFSPRNALPRA